ncbi:hypothetical protein [Erythrobacter ani]|uniref:Uncharacterized protein n=1 Tax=Erythrobacter ani TaxID=2827235 RepID=A0ABS6SNB8_9SPHN|nr:hypothetical protein [Erythrobacter ani]MBV7266002.1 hypothetical protein [Erythrobacter ani]
MAIALLIGSALLVSLQAQAAPQTSEDEPKAVEASEVSANPTEAVDAEPEVTAAAAEEDEIICRRTRVVGSRFNKKLCGTKAQWEAMSDRSRDTAQEFQRKGRSIRQPGG